MSKLKANKLLLFIVLYSITPVVYADKVISAIRSIEDILKKPIRTQQDKQKAQELINSLKSNTQRSIQEKAKQLETRLKDDNCTEQLEKVKKVIGEENLNKILQGQLIELFSTQSDKSVVQRVLERDKQMCFKRHSIVEKQLEELLGKENATKFKTVVDKIFNDEQPEAITKVIKIQSVPQPQDQPSANTSTEKQKEQDSVEGTDAQVLEQIMWDLQNS